MAISVLDIECGQAAIRGPTGIRNCPGLYIWDEERDVDVSMPWKDALRLALWILWGQERFDLGARIQVLEKGDEAECRIIEDSDTEYGGDSRSHKLFKTFQKPESENLTHESDCKRDGCTCGGHCESCGCEDIRTKDKMTPSEIRERNIDTLRWCDGRILAFYREMDPVRLTLSTVDESLGGKDFSRVYESLHGVHTAINRHLNDLCGEAGKGLDFGDVVRAMKADPSRRFRRKGWNGEGMFIYYVRGSSVRDQAWMPESDVTKAERRKGQVDVNAHIDMYAADGRRVIGWLASQTDMLAEDWVEVTE